MGTLMGLDWGTTHRRAYALDAQGHCVHAYADADGALASKGRFGAALASAVHQMPTRPDVVVMAGMVGSALGWQEVPYVGGSVALESLAQHVVALKDAPDGMRCVLIPGMCVRDAQGQADVMRGEETQLLGALALGHSDGWYVLPGTHSKWVELKAGHVVQLRTYLTGELFGLLITHGTLAAAAGAAPALWDDGAFGDGVAAARHGTLSHSLFGCRARVVCGDMPATSTRAYLSGLLIGSELHDLLRAPAGAHRVSGFKLLGAPELAAHYQSAAALLGLEVQLIDAKAAFVAAMAHFQSTLGKP